MPLLATPMTIVRPADATELDAVIDVLRSANLQFADVLPAAVYAAYLANVLDVHNRLADSELLVAELDGQIAGTITVYPDASREGWDWPAHWAGLRAIAVAPAARGRGLGRQLAEAALTRAHDLGQDAVCLHTAHFMGSAVPLYESLGFRRCPEYDQDVTQLFGLNPGDEPLLAVGYCLHLTP